MICRSLRMESICSGAILNERFRGSPMISNDRATKRFLAISVNRAKRLERRTGAVTLTVLPAWEEAARGRGTGEDARARPEAGPPAAGGVDAGQRGGR